MTLSATALFAALGSGCGGSLGSNNSGSTTGTRIRAINAGIGITTATLSLNGVSSTGNLAPGTASAYTAVTTSTGASLTDTLTGATSGQKYVSLIYDFGTNADYTIILFGRGDVSSSFDTRSPRLAVATDDVATPAAGNARVRIVHAGTDAGNVDVSVNESGASKIGLTGVTYGTIEAYQEVTAGGTVPVVVTQSSGGAVLVNKTINIASGIAYTLVISETINNSVPSYDAILFDDAR